MTVAPCQILSSAYLCSLLNIVPLDCNPPRRTIDSGKILKNYVDNTFSCISPWWVSKGPNNRYVFFHRT